MVSLFYNGITLLVMHTTILDLASEYLQASSAESVLTFRPFLNYIKNLKEKSSGNKTRLLSYIIEKYEQHPELLGPVDVACVKDHEPLLELIYSILSPLIEDEELHYWALSMPLRPVMFYSTNAYFNMVSHITQGKLTKQLSGEKLEKVRYNQLEFSYSLILEKCYNISSFFKQEIIHSIKDEKSGLLRYFRMTIDRRFIEVYHNDPLPELKLETLQSIGHDHHEMIALVEKIIPLSMFRFEGFGIASITEVTSQQSIENIRSIILNRSSFEEGTYYSSVIDSLQALVGSNDVKFGLLPVLQVNDKLVFNDGTCLNSILVKAGKEQGIAEMAYLSLAAHYFKKPRLIFFREITIEDESRQIYLKMLKTAGISAYALVPIFYNNTLEGVLEVYSLKKDALNEDMLSRLDPAMSLLSQLLKNNIDEFNDSIERVVKEKFTSLQPSVQWKFNEVAWHYLRDKHVNGKPVELEEIEFENVYPLYGAVDIRNSSIERNAALNKDHQVQFTVLLEVLHDLKKQSGFGLIDEKIFLSQKYLDLINSPQGFNQEIKLNDFLENNIAPFLQQFKEGNPAAERIMEKYFNAIDIKQGIANESRTLLETSMNTVIAAVNKYMESMKEEIQHAYPCYFEKFRTDGVEYDIYIGQSITPDKPFKDIFLKNLRLLQLNSMAVIAKYSHSLLVDLPVPIQTTQLIFIHSQPIDIRFRKDEKRFDVEGAYNIRYQIIKKRIDKVRIRNSKERLTQPNKIALVYVNQHEANEYINYIHYLQEQHILAGDLEELDLEDLQGVNGLKALRVSVITD